MIDGGRENSGFALLGTALAIVGAGLDFYSSYQILSYPLMTADSRGMMTVPSSVPSTIWGVGLAVLGVMLLASALAGVTSYGAGRGRLLGALMAAYGVLMLLVGAAMSTGVSPTMQTASLAGLGMLVVGALMVVNGSAMMRMKKMPQGQNPR